MKSFTHNILKQEVDLKRKKLLPFPGKYPTRIAWEMLMVVGRKRYHRTYYGKPCALQVKRLLGLVIAADRAASKNYGIQAQWRYGELDRGGLLFKEDHKGRGKVSSFMLAYRPVYGPSVADSRLPQFVHKVKTTTGNFWRFYSPWTLDFRFELVKAGFQRVGIQLT